MPQWFLKFWMQAAALVGSAWISVSSGIMSLLATSQGAGSANASIVSTDATGATPATNTLGMYSIDLQSLRIAGTGALGQYDVVIGSSNGLVLGVGATMPSAFSKYQQNTIIGASNSAQMWSGWNAGKNTIIGFANHKLYNSHQTSTDVGQDTLLGVSNSLASSSGNNTLVGKGNSLSILAGTTSNTVWSQASVFGNGNSFLTPGVGVTMSSLAVFGNSNTSALSDTTFNLSGACAVVGIANSLTGNLSGCMLIGMTGNIGSAGSSTTGLVRLVSGYSAIDLWVSQTGVGLITLGTISTAEAMYGANVARHCAEALPKTGSNAVTANGTLATINSDCTEIPVIGTTATSFKFPATPIEGHRLVLFGIGGATIGLQANTGQALASGQTFTGIALPNGGSVEFFYNISQPNLTANTWYRIR